MKKNIAMRVAAFLFILTMITTCAFATTFAKYTTKGEAEDYARVAKWGVTVVVQNKDGSFQTKYASNTTGVTGDTVISAGADAQSIKKLVAPGTSGHLVSISVTGKPEVSTKVTIDVNIDFEKWYIDEGSTFYCPIVITYKVNGGAEQTISGLNHTSAASFENALDAVFDLKTDNTYTPNTDLVRSLEISWSWAFGGDDVKDTKLGDLAVAPTISFTADCTVEQLD